MNRVKTLPSFGKVFRAMDRIRQSISDYSFGTKLIFDGLFALV